MKKNKKNLQIIAIGMLVLAAMVVVYLYVK